MRGLQQAPGGRVLPQGIIPARAGFTVRDSDLSIHFADHPRACGVYGPTRYCSRPAAGSSPRVRGLQVLDLLSALVRWIIPARAGFTPPPTPATGRWGDHPRACGVYLLNTGSGRLDLGSSPRVRGLQIRQHGEVVTAGIIPARAGFTEGLWVGKVCLRDHPRACGVYWYGVVFPEGVAGSSPRVRGLRPGHQDQLPGVGIIPARAGFTLSRPCGDGPASDHPRACGVYTGLYDAEVMAHGSSPRVRGLPRHGGRGPPGSGIIPARAGFTASWVVFRYA